MIYGFQVIRPERMARIVAPPPLTRLGRIAESLREGWEFVRAVFWPCLLFAIAVTVLRLSW
jgi:hypothetical protein